MDKTRGVGVTRREAMKALAAAPLLAHAAKAQAQRSDRPNIIIFHCHDLGQYLGCYGVPTVQTPNIDRLASQGVRLAQSYCTAPQCSPSRASLFTGRYPHNTGVLGLTHGRFAWDLHGEERHIGQLLRDAGYRTAGVGTLHETRSGAERCGLQAYKPNARAVNAADNAIAFIEDFGKDSTTPFYMQVGTIEPHRLNSKFSMEYMGFDGPNVKPDASKGVHVPPWLKDTAGTRTELAELQGSMKHVDEQVGRVLDALRASGLEDNTLFVFTTDHGIAMPRAKCSLYDPGLQVACVLRLPSREGWHGGHTINEMIQNIDYVPSLLDVAGVAHPPDLHGQSFAPLLDGGTYAARDAIFGEITYHDYYDPRRCIRTNRYKLIANFTTAPFFMDPSQSWRPRSETVVPENHATAYHEHLELYDLEADPWEQEDLARAPEHEETVRSLLRRLRDHLEATHDPILKGAVTPPHHETVLELLAKA